MSLESVFSAIREYNGSAAIQDESLEGLKFHQGLKITFSALPTE